jgi:hypothetical protein
MIEGAIPEAAQAPSMLTKRAATAPSSLAEAIRAKPRPSRRGRERR